ncbi:MAG: hypothetical protein GY804_04990 [Alphaproteobacteria bacterium]|nr:hypothetical protein [Alphaproteobacteria bacterium]
MHDAIYCEDKKYPKHSASNTSDEHLNEIRSNLPTLANADKNIKPKSSSFVKPPIIDSIDPATIQKRMARKPRKKITTNGVNGTPRGQQKTMTEDGGDNFAGFTKNVGHHDGSDFAAIRIPKRFPHQTLAIKGRCHDGQTRASIFDHNDKNFPTALTPKIAQKWKSALEHEMKISFVNGQYQNDTLQLLSNIANKKQPSKFLSNMACEVVMETLIHQGFKEPQKLNPLQQTYYTNARSGKHR